MKRYRRLLAAASRTITSRSCLHVLPARVEARAVAIWRKDDKVGVSEGLERTEKLVAELVGPVLPVSLGEGRREARARSRQKLYGQAPLTLAEDRLNGSHDPLQATDRDSVAHLECFLPAQVRWPVATNSSPRRSS